MLAQTRSDNQVSSAATATCDPEPNPELPPGDPASVADHEIHWLEPDQVQLSVGSLNTLRLQIKDQDPVDGVFVICAFPATSMERYLSLRVWDADGDDHEIGMIRDLSAWPAAQQQLVRAQRRRRYLFRQIQGIDSLDLKHGHLYFKVRTDVGPQEFCMRWSQNQAIDFGTQGKMIFDVEDNRYIIADVEALPARR